MSQRHMLFPKASLVQAPPKGLCHHSKSVLLPCPPHRIAPLWEREHLPRAERTTRFNDQPSSTQLPLHPYRTTEPATLTWRTHAATNAAPLPYLKYQGTNKPSPHPGHLDPSGLSLPNPKFWERTNIALGTPSKCVKTPLYPKHRVETPDFLERFPTILRSPHSQKAEPPHLRQKQPPIPFPEHQSETWPHLKQQPLYHEFKPHYQAEELSQHRQKPPSSPPILDQHGEATSLKDGKIRAIGEPTTFPDLQASARPAPVSFGHLEEAAQNDKHQVRILTFMLGGGGTNLWPKCLILQSSCKDHNSKMEMVLEKASDLDYLVNKPSRHRDLAFMETALPFLSLNQQSGAWASPSSLPKYVNRSTSTEVTWPQFNVMFTRTTSPDPNHQTKITMRQSRDFILSTRAASDPSLFLGTLENSGPFQCPEYAAEALPGPDYKVKDTTGPPHSGHKVKIPPPGIDHFNEVSPDLRHQATIPMEPEQRISPSGVLSSGPTEASRSKTQVITPLFLPINQIESLPCPKRLGKDSLTLQYQSQGHAGVGQVEAPVDPDNQVAPSLWPEQQTPAIWGPDCQTLVTPSPNDHVQFLNIFDHQEKEPLAPDTQASHELVGTHYQTQTVPGPREIIPLLHDKTKAIPPLGHDHTTEPESQAKKATQLASPAKQAIPQLFPDYCMIPPQTTAYHIRETVPATSAQVTPYETEVDFWKAMPQDPDHQTTTPPCQDDGAAPSQGIDYQVITTSGQDDSETPSLGIEDHVIMPPGQDDSETPSLGIGPQVIIPPGQGDGETFLLGIEGHVIIPLWQDDSETPSRGTDCQIRTSPGQYDSETLSWSREGHVITPPWQDDNSETPLLDIDHQVITSPWQDDSETPSLGVVHQIITSPWQDDSETPSLGIESHVIMPPGQDDNETPSLGIDPQFIMPPGQDDNETSLLGIDCWVITLPWHDDSSETTSLGIDHQVITLPWQDDSETPSLVIDHQVTASPCQNDGAVLPSQGIGHEVTTLPDSDHVTIATPSPDLKLGATLKPSEQVTPLHDRGHEANMSVTPEYQNTTSFGLNNQVEIGSDTTNNQSTLPAGKDDQVKAFPEPKKKTIPLSTVSHQKDPQTGHGHHQAKVSLTSYHKDKAQSGFQHQTVKKREIPWHLKYIKPYTIEGRSNVSARTVRSIISSIPEEKIKRDIRKQILFRRMKESPPQRPGECMSTSYSICLECTSWVPSGCLHDKRMKNQFEAEMLAIPMPLPGSEEEMGLKFVLRVPYKPFSFFSQLFPELNIQWPSYYSPYFPSFSRKSTTKAKWLDYSETDGNPWKSKTSKSHQPLTEENLPMERECNEKEKARGHGKSFKSLLEKFQRQRQN